MTHAGPTRPQHGGRIQLERLDRASTPDAAHVHYRLTLWTAEARWTTEVSLATTEWALAYGTWSAERLAGELPDGDLPDVGMPPQWLQGTTEAFLRSLWRARQKADAPPWPRRLSRWREARK